MTEGVPLARGVPAPTDLADASIEDLFRDAGALREGHFRLKSGLHSPRYLEKFLVLQYPTLASELCRRMAHHVADLGPNVVVGPTTGGVLLAFERRAAQLAQLAGRFGARGNLETFVEGERRAGRIFFRDAGDLKAQLSVWRGRRLDRLVRRLAAIHRAVLANSAAAEILLAQELSEIARRAVVQPKNR